MDQGQVILEYRSKHICRSAVLNPTMCKSTLKYKTTIVRSRTSHIRIKITTQISVHKGPNLHVLLRLVSLYPTWCQ